MTTQSESVDWFAECREASAYAFTLKAELRSVEEKNRLLHQRHHDDNVEYTRVLAQRDALLEALKYIDTEFRKHGRQHWPEAVRARAAIAAVEGEKK